MLNLFSQAAFVLMQLFQDLVAIPLLNAAAVTVFFKSIATVIGPTPPGTGEANAAFYIMSSKSVSPTSLSL